jgi:hypothetical protein
VTAKEIDAIIKQIEKENETDDDKEVDIGIPEFQEIY